MLRRKTTIIVGAGASCELGLPSGEQLKQDIKDVLRTTNEHVFRIADSALIDGLRQTYGSLSTDDQQRLQQIAAAAERIRRGLPLAPSIDNYLHTHQADATVVNLGKAAIARIILRAERNSILFGHRKNTYSINSRTPEPKPSLESSDLYNTWYTSLAQLLFSLTPKDAPRTALQNVNFVIFNYDRCLEHFLWMALQAYFDLNEEEAADVLSSVDFIHPYGSLGPLPWQAGPGQSALPLGGEAGVNLFTVGERLKTFTESVQSETGTQVASAVSQAEMTILLGFGFLEQNMQLLAPKPLKEQGAGLVLCTAYGIKEPSHRIISSLLKRLAQKYTEPSSLLIEPGKCVDLFQNYSLHLRY